jgi:hypothetical protein
MGGGAKQLDGDDRRVVKIKVAQALGHNRPSVTSAYIGSFKAGEPAADDHGVETIQKALRLLEVVGLPAVPSERVSDCQLIWNAVASLGLALSEEQIHMLWAKTSGRNGVEWMTPENEIPLALRASAEAMLNDFFVK